MEGIKPSLQILHLVLANSFSELRVEKNVMVDTCRTDALLKKVEYLWGV